MENFKDLQKRLSQLGTSLLVIAFVTGCAGQGEMDWASENDPNQDELEVPEIPEVETPEEEPEEETPEDPIEPSTVSFYTNGNYYTLARNRALRWEGCETSARARGGYMSDSSCGRAFLYDKFVRHLNNHFFRCVERAAQSANLSQPNRVFINHLGSYNDRTARGSSRLSMHAYARALDVKNINLIDSRGNVYRISTHINDFRGATAKFYDSFRGCWKDTMPSNCVPGQTEYQGSIGHNKSSVSGTNSLHNDHIHLSFPFCAGA